MQVLILDEHHGDWYFKIESNLDLHNVCLKILKIRLDQGWYNHMTKPETFEKKFEITREQYDNLPQALKTALSRQICEYDVDCKRYKKMIKFHEDIKRLSGLTDLTENCIDVKFKTAFNLLEHMHAGSIKLEELYTVGDYK
jgi:hypothetical protein